MKIEKKILSKNQIAEKNLKIRQQRAQEKALQELEEKSKESTVSKKRGRPAKDKETVKTKEVAVKEVAAKEKSSKRKAKEPAKPEKAPKKVKTASVRPPKEKETPTYLPHNAQENAQQVIKTLKGCYQSPVLPVRFSSVKNPYKFANNDIPRYSITLILDEKKNKHFISQLENLRTQQGAESFRSEMSFVNDKGFKIGTGKSLIKFQGKEKIPVYYKDGSELELTSEIPEKTLVSVEFEIRCYLNKRTDQNAFNFKPVRIFIHSKE